MAKLTPHQFIDLAFAKEITVEGEVVKRQNPLLGGFRQALECHELTHLVAGLLKSHRWPESSPKEHVNLRYQPHMQSEADYRENHSDSHLATEQKGEERKLRSQSFTSSYIDLALLLDGTGEQ